MIGILKRILFLISFLLIAMGVCYLSRVCLGKIPITVLIVLIAVTLLAFLLKVKVSARMAYRKQLMLGCDFGLQDEWLLEVPRLLELNGVPAKKQLSKKLTLPPVFNEVVVRYSSVKRKKGPALFSRKLMYELCIGCKDGKDYYCFSGRDEVYYCVRVSDLDETIYKLDLEWSKPPVPFASDIYHYFALRYFRQDDD